MKNPDTHELIAGALKGKLSRSEQQAFDRHLREDPAFREDWGLERALENALEHLPDAPVSSNFTHLVMQAARRDEDGAQRAGKRSWFRLAWPRLAAGLGLTCAIAFTLVQQHERAQFREVGQTINDFNKVAAAFGEQGAPEVFANFDAIQRLNIPAQSEMDMELLAALQ